MNKLRNLLRKINYFYEASHEIKKNLQQYLQRAGQKCSMGINIW